MRLLKRREAGEDERFEDLFRREFAPLVRALTLVAGDVEVAADAVQDAFVQAHHHRDHVLGLESPAGWLRHVALNRIKNQHRGRSRERNALPHLIESEITELGCDDELTALPLLISLSPQQRATAAMYYLLDQPTSAIADHLGITEATVRSHLRSARTNLQRDLREGA